MDFRSCIEFERKNGSLQEIERQLNPHLEASAAIANAEPLPILLNSTRNMQITANLFCNRETYARYLGIPVSNFLKNLSRKFTQNQPKLIVKDEVYGEIERDQVDLAELPILTHYQGDGGPYITAGVWIVNDPLSGRNLSFHRLMVINATQGTARVVENRGMFLALSHTNQQAEVAVCLGVSPSVLLAAACSPSDNIDELELAARLEPITLVKCKTINVHVPVDCEIVLEGHFINKHAAEGPFVDISGTWDKVRHQPIFEITRIAHRKNAIYHALIPGKFEHRILMGMPKEIDIFNEVNKVCPCLDVRVTDGGCAWLHVVVQIRKQHAEDGKLALEAAFRAHKSLKHCVVVDEDINIQNMNEVEWAIATRFQADKDLLILSDQPSSSLDPSANHAAGRKSKGSKMGLDATIKKWGKDRDLFLKVT